MLVPLICFELSVLATWRLCGNELRMTLINDIWKIILAADCLLPTAYFINRPATRRSTTRTPFLI